MAHEGSLEGLACSRAPSKPSWTCQRPAMDLAEPSRRPRKYPEGPGSGRPLGARAGRPFTASASGFPRQVHGGCTPGRCQVHRECTGCSSEADPRDAPLAGRSSPCGRQGLPGDGHEVGARPWRGVIGFAGPAPPGGEPDPRTLTGLCQAATMTALATLLAEGWRAAARLSDLRWVSAVERCGAGDGRARHHDRRPRGGDGQLRRARAVPPARPAGPLLVSACSPGVTVAVTPPAGPGIPPQRRNQRQRDRQSPG
jgi:hypothetical protein